MQITDFSHAHIPQAMALLAQNYSEARGHFPSLPLLSTLPGLGNLTKNGLGVAAFEGDTLLGYLLCFPPFERSFRSTQARGVFSPLHGHGALPQDRGKTYAHLYQAAAAKWVRAGAVSHGISLYAHDPTPKDLFFHYGFGLRCVDGVRDMGKMVTPDCPTFSMALLRAEEYLQVMPLVRQLEDHMAQSPTFIRRLPETQAAFLKSMAHSHARLWVARDQDTAMAFIQVERQGETFVHLSPHYRHITKAYCLPAYRGKGVMQHLLNQALHDLHNEGVAHLGVDFESINPAAHRFWTKHFTAYTHGLARRIDEDVLG